MKLGNTSQSKVPVPDFFITKNLKQMETFQVSDRKRYFREKDLFRMTKDLNFCNNPRNYNRKHENFNKEKYQPDLNNINLLLTNYNTTNSKKFLNTIVSPKANTYDNFRYFLEKTNVTNFTNPDLREEIRGNINILINRINDEYDLNKWASTDTRANFMPTNTENYFTKNNFNSSTNRIYFTTKTDKKFNETDASKFKTILRDKINTMSLDRNLKTKLVKNVDIFNDSISDKFYKTKTSNIITNFNQIKNENLNSSTTENFKKENMNNTNQDHNLRTSLSNEKYFHKEITLNSNKKINNSSTFSNFKSLNMNKNNYSINNNEMIDINDNFNIGKITLPVVATKYSGVNSNFYNNFNEIENLKIENEKIYDRFKDSTLYKDFPSPDRKEFVLKKGEKLRAKTKHDKIDKNLVNFSNYNANKHKTVFCEDYDTNDGFMVKFKKSKEVF